MEHLLTPTSSTVGTRVVGTLIEYIGTHEPDNRAVIQTMPAADPHRASLLIGQACAELAHGNDNVADPALKQARELLRITLDTPRVPTLRKMAIDLRSMTNLLLARDDPEAPE